VLTETRSVVYNKSVALPQRGTSDRRDFISPLV